MAHPMVPMTQGDRFGRLTVLEERERGKRLIKTKCDCGRLLAVRPHYLVAGTRSCGCLRREIAARSASALHQPKERA